MICYVLAMGKQHLGPHVVVGYGIKIFWPGLFIMSPDHLERIVHLFLISLLCLRQKKPSKKNDYEKSIFSTKFIYSHTQQTKEKRDYL